MRENPHGNDCFSPTSRESGQAASEIDVSYAVYFTWDSHERHKCIYGYLPSSFAPQGTHLARVPPHTFILYMPTVTRLATEKVKWKRFVFLPLSSGSDDAEKIWSVNLQIHPPTVFIWEHVSTLETRIDKNRIFITSLCVFLSDMSLYLIFSEANYKLAWMWTCPKKKFRFNLAARNS